MLRCILAIILMTFSLSALAADLTVLLGSDSNPESKGIYSITFDPAKGQWTGDVELAAPLRSAGFQVRHPRLPVLYSAGAPPGATGQQASAYRMEWQEGGLQLSHLNSVPTDSELITHLAVDPQGELLVTAHYGAGKVAVFPLRSDGKLAPHSQLLDHGKGSGVDAERQEKARPHHVAFAPGGRFVLVCDLGTDAVHVYRVDREGQRLVAHQKAPAPPGSGPRHMKFSPDGRFAMVLNELALTLSTYAWDGERGMLKLLHVIPTLPEEVKSREIRNTASEIAFHPSGRFVYSANRGNDSISVFEMERDTGRLQVIEVEPVRAAWPRHFALDPSGKWLICGGQDSSTVGVFAIDSQSGQLTYQPKSSLVVPHPICITFLVPGE